MVNISRKFSVGILIGVDIINILTKLSSKKFLSYFSSILRTIWDLQPINSNLSVLKALFKFIFSLPFGIHNFRFLFLYPGIQ